MRGLSMIVGLTVACGVAFGCDIEDIEDIEEQEMVEFRLLEEGESPEDAEFGEVVVPKVAELYDNCTGQCAGASCDAGSCWYQAQGTIQKISGTDIPCHQTVAGACRCNIANKATVVNALKAKGWTIGGNAPRDASDQDDGEMCEPVAEPL